MPTDLQNNVLTARAELLAAKKLALITAGFSEQAAFQIVLADIEAGLGELGLATDPAIVSATELVAQFDSSALVGTWSIAPSLNVESPPLLQERLSLLSTSVRLSLNTERRHRMTVEFFRGNVVRGRVSNSDIRHCSTGVLRRRRAVDSGRLLGECKN